METNPTALLLDLAAQARRVTDSEALYDLLSRGHRAWCEGVTDVQAGVDRDTASLSDAQLAERCAAAGAPSEEGMTRAEAVSALAFVTWDAAPAARGGGYWVSGPLRTEAVGPAATAEDAIAMVIAKLPANAGPAFVGTPEQLAAYEASLGPHPTANPEVE